VGGVVRVTVFENLLALRDMWKNFNDILRADKGTRHAPANLTEDIITQFTLMQSLDENRDNVYRTQSLKGRVLDDDDEPIKNDIATGLRNQQKPTF
jgi:hypothetical protein